MNLSQPKKHLAKIVPALTATAAGVLLLGMSSSAHATLQFSANVNGTLRCAIDNVFTSGLACPGFAGATTIADTDPTLGSLSLGNGTVIGGITVNGSLQTASKSLAQNILNSSSLSVVNNSGALANIDLSVGDTFFIGPNNVAFSTGSGTFVTAGGSTLSMQWFNDPQNVQGGDNGPTDTPGNLLDSFNTAAVGPNFSFAHNGGPFAVNDPGFFSMTERFTYTLVAGGSLIGRSQSEIKQGVPEPATLMLLGVGLAGMGLRYRRRT